MKNLVRAIEVLAQNDTKDTQQYRYDFKGIAIGPFREHTIHQEVSDLDPDGFVSDAATGDMIIDAIDWGERYISYDWESQGNHELLSVWDLEEEYDRKAPYMGAVIRTKLNADSDLD